MEEVGGQEKIQRLHSPPFSSSSILQVSAFSFLLLAENEYHIHEKATQMMLAIHAVKIIFDSTRTSSQDELYSLTADDGGDDRRGGCAFHHIHLVQKLLVPNSPSVVMKSFSFPPKKNLFFFFSFADPSTSLAREANFPAFTFWADANHDDDDPTSRDDDDDDDES